MSETSTYDTPRSVGRTGLRSVYRAMSWEGLERTVLRLRVLGPTEVLGDDGPAKIGAGQPRTVLAALALSAGTTCTTDALIDAVWGESPPASASKLLQVYVSRLRKLLPAGIGIETRPTGYHRKVDPSAVDAVRFEREVGDGRAALEAGNPALAAAVLARALALWRGPAYADVRYAPFAEAEIERLERLRDFCVELRTDAQLDLGHHADVLAELRGRLIEDPANETLAARAILAAYRTSGAAEALEIFGRTEAALASELDTEPSPELIALRERVVRRDPSLELPPDAAGSSSHPLPEAPNRLVGRQRELAELRTLVGDPGVRLVSLTGAGGSGKTRLALEVARELGPTFANGSALVEMASLTDPSLVPATIAVALGVDPGADPMASLLRAVAGRELLLVLDTLEHLREATPELVRLLAGAPRLVILATTRVVLHASGEHVFPVHPLAEEDAVELFGERARAQDPAFSRAAETDALAATICRRLDGIPLAIELAAPRVRALGLKGLDERLASRLTVLTGGPRDLPARQQTLQDTIAWSVRLLEPAHVDAFAALAVFAGGCSMEAARRVADADDEAMITLVDHSLVQAYDHAGERRFRMLDTVREFASERQGERRDAINSALVSWMADLVAGLSIGFRGPPRAEALDRLEVEVDNLRTALLLARDDPEPDRELAIAGGIGLFWRARGHLAEGRAVYEGIVERRGLVPTTYGIRVARRAATLAWSTGDLDRAAALAEAALDAANRIDDAEGQSHGHNLLGALAALRGDLEAAVPHLQEAIERSQADTDLESAYTSRLNLGVVYRDMGRLDEAREHFQAVLEYRAGEGQSLGFGMAQLNLGELEYQAVDLSASEAHFGAAASAFEAFGDRVRFANALQGLAAVEARTGRAESAARRLGQAATMIQDVGWSVGWSGDGPNLVAEAAAAAREALGDETFDRLSAEGAAQEGPTLDGARVVNDGSERQGRS